MFGELRRPGDYGAGDPARRGSARASGRRSAPASTPGALSVGLNGDAGSTEVLRAGFDGSSPWGAADAAGSAAAGPGRQGSLRADHNRSAQMRVVAVAGAKGRVSKTAAASTSR